jgi:hypothetical protein
MQLRFRLCVCDSFLTQFFRLIGLNLELKFRQFAIVRRTLKACFNQLQRLSQLAGSSKTFCLGQPLHTLSRGRRHLSCVTQRLRPGELSQAVIKSAQRFLKLACLHLTVRLALNLSDPLLTGERLSNRDQFVDLFFSRVLRRHLLEDLYSKCRLPLIQEILSLSDCIPYRLLEHSL